MSIPSFSRPLSGPGANTTPTRRLPANPAKFTPAVYVRGEDIFVPVCCATAFGGPLDRLDSGATASGIYTNRPGGVKGCALPMPAARACIGTPLPQLPWSTPVKVMLANREITIPVIDEGPAGGLKSQAFIDITLEAWEDLLGKKLAPTEVNYLSRMVSVLIPGAAKYIGDYHPAGVPDSDSE